MVVGRSSGLDTAKLVLRPAHAWPAHRHAALLTHSLRGGAFRSVSRLGSEGTTDGAPRRGSAKHTIVPEMRILSAWPSGRLPWVRRTDLRQGTILTVLTCSPMSSK